ncbi:hypothetical protein [Primorskyibacter sp. S87]|uniref:hypothetical protein n=1 Tax=Primorskyibacter sp. S87 TaxID=3415126 RepID=UPI003C7B6785
MRLAISLLALLLVLAVGASAALLLRSCGVRLPIIGTVFSFCETAEVLQRRADLATEDQLTRDLTGQVTALEQRLALLQCEADPPPPPPPPPPPKPKTPSGLAPDAFNDRDISKMEGCWQLSSNYAVREIRTGEITQFKYWRICFDRNGNGTQVMRSTNGTRCEGRLTGRLPGNGKLTMREPGNLKCSNGSEIFRRDITCRLDARGNAHCDTYQPETNGRSNATLRRARR